MSEVRNAGGQALNCIFNPSLDLSESVSYSETYIVASALGDFTLSTRSYAALATTKVWQSC